MNIFLFFCFLTSLLPCFFSYRKIKGNYNEANLFIFLASVIYSLLFLYGLTVRLYLGNASNEATIQQMYVLVNQTSWNIKQLNYLLIAATVVLAIVNIILGIIIRKSSRPITYCLLIIIVLLSLLSCYATVFTGISPFANFFIICCGIMAYFAFILELTYKEFCVLGNIYLQSFISLLSALAPVMLCLRNGRIVKYSVKNTIIYTNAVLHGIIFIGICKHYWMPLDHGFDLCYHELMRLASITGLTYIIVNLLIFVFIFIADLGFNAVLYKIAK